VKAILSAIGGTEETRAVRPPICIEYPAKYVYLHFSFGCYHFTSFSGLHRPPRRRRISCLFPAHGDDCMPVTPLSLASPVIQHGHNAERLRLPPLLLGARKEDPAASTE
jgi:hypothetical protein